jgi:hypothetical protein
MEEGYVFACDRCGLMVYSAIPPPPETIYCLTCRWLAGIDDPRARAEAEAFLAKLEQQGEQPAEQAHGEQEDREEEAEGAG